MLQHHVAGRGEEAEPEQVLGDYRELSDNDGRHPTLLLGLGETAWRIGRPAWAAPHREGSQGGDHVVEDNDDEEAEQCLG